MIPEPGQIRILAVDDHALLREGIALALQGKSVEDVVAELDG